MITIQDMITRFGEQEMAERSNHENYETIDEAVMAAAIADAEEEAASYLRAAKLFFTNDTAPQVLKIKVCDIARYYLYDDAVTGIVEERYQSAIAWLKIVVKNPNMLDETRVSDDRRPSTCAVYVNAEPDLREWLKE